MQNYHFDPQDYKTELTGIISALLSLKKVHEKKVDSILKRFPKGKDKIFSRDNLIRGIDWLISDIRDQVSDVRKSFKIEDKDLLISSLQSLISQIKMKPMRTQSGVTTVTVLTKPFACPGQCIFCPNDVRMPKSYIATEPGAQRALMNRFSPYTQVYNRLQALKNIGHPTDKIELLILGGTWSYYPKKYQVWFIHECFRAMNEFSYQSSVVSSQLATLDISEDLKNDFNDVLRKVTGNKPYNQLIQTKEFKEHFSKYIVDEEDVSWDDLNKQQEINSSGKCRCVGLVLETRPDTIDEKEVLDLRKLGATKVQLGIQTLDDEISTLNKRGEKKEDTARAFELLRAGGFKIHGHIMPNLFGATPEKDFATYKELFETKDFKPDELKIYPTSIIKNTELYERWKEGKYTPYSTDQLIDLISKCMEVTPEYCRLTRIIRDIPSTEIADGNMTTNLREIVEHKLEKEGRKNPNIRAREIRNKKVKFEDLSLDIFEYKTKATTEYFLQYITNGRLIAGFLRLSIPDSHVNPITDELNDAAMIREVHVYGPSLELGRRDSGITPTDAQHIGLGTKLIEEAKEISKSKGFDKLAVISSIGTREYYDKRGFKLKKYYQIAKL